MCRGDIYFWCIFIPLYCIIGYFNVLSDNLMFCLILVLLGIPALLMHVNERFGIWMGSSIGKDWWS